jgi:hypothetical protein
LHRRGAEACRCTDTLCRAFKHGRVVVHARTSRLRTVPRRGAHCPRLFPVPTTESEIVMMKKSLLVVLSAAAACVAAPAFSQQLKAEGVATAASAPGRAEVARAVRVSATVTAIDKATRTVTLKGADGKEFPVVAGAEVRNFDQITVGSEVVVGYLQALALDLKKGGGAKREAVVEEAGGRAAAGAQPGAAAGRKITVVADVTALDKATQTVTLRGPQRTVELNVPDPKQFALIAVGDQVQATYTEAVAISVEPAAKK